MAPRTLIFFLIFTLMPGFTRASYADMDVYIQRARQAEKEQDPALAIGMYSQLLKEYDEKAPKSEQMQYAQTLLHAAELCAEQNRFLECFDMNTTGLMAAMRWGDPKTQMKYLGGLGNLHLTFEDYERSLATTAGATGWPSNKRTCPCNTRSCKLSP